MFKIKKKKDKDNGKDYEGGRERKGMKEAEHNYAPFHIKKHILLFQAISYI